MARSVYLLILIIAFTTEDFPVEKDKIFFDLLPSGFEHQSYQIETEDYYYLKLFRISNNNFKGKPVLLLHGILDSADAWIVNQKQSIAKELVNQGYDVWLLNFRGNKYSGEHKFFQENDEFYWNFSFDQMGQFDFPATINFIFQKVNQKISIIAHSQGVTSTLIAFSTEPDLQKKIDGVLMLGPVVFMDQLKNTSAIYNILTMKNLAGMLKRMGIYRFGENPMYKSLLEKVTIKLFCNTYINFCDIFFKHFTDENTEHLDKDQIKYFLSRVPSRTSVTTLEHWTQLIQVSNQTLPAFNYGEEKNKLIYKTPWPKIYDFSQIYIPLYIYQGNNDILCSERNIELLTQQLKIFRKRVFENWGHMTYFWGKDISILLENINSDLKEISENYIQLILQT